IELVSITVLEGTTPEPLPLTALLERCLSAIFIRRHHRHHCAASRQLCQNGRGVEELSSSRRRTVRCSQWNGQHSSMLCTDHNFTTTTAASANRFTAHSLRQQILANGTLQPQPPPLVALWAQAFLYFASN